MSHSPVDLPPNNDAYDRLVLHGLCEELLDKDFPSWLSRSSIAQTAVAAAIDNAGLSKQVNTNMYVIQDTLSDDIPSYRVRLVPGDLRRGVVFKDGAVSAVKINVPRPFVIDIANASGIELGLIEIYTDDAYGDTASYRYAVTAEQIFAYEEFSSLDFVFSKSKIDEVLNIQKPDTKDGKADESTLDVTSQLEIARLMKVVCSSYVLGTISRTDKTM